MSAPIASCGTPCAAAPVAPQQPTTATGGGAAPATTADAGATNAAPTAADEAAPDPAPVPGAQPAAPSTDVSGGGPTSAASTGYDPAPAPSGCGQWVPAPVVVGGDVAPDPIALSDAPASQAPTPGSGAGDPATASALATWPQWQQQFTRLGLAPEEVAKLGAAPLDDVQLALIYEEVHGGIVQSGGTPGEPLDAAGASAWATWEPRFAALGLPAALLAELRLQAEQRGSGDAELAAVHARLAQQLASAGAPAPKAPGTAGLPELGPAPAPAPAPAPEGPGWNAQVEAAFRQLGMPEEVVRIYAESGAPLHGLEAAHRHAAGRVQAVRDSGWWDRLVEAKAPPLEIWKVILADKPPTDADLQKLLEASRKAQRSTLARGAQLTSSLVPGGRLLQYAMGRELVSKDKIDRMKPMEIGAAALSGLAMFATIRGARTIGAGWAARGGGYANLNSVNGTMTSLGLPAMGTSALSDTALGATQTWGLRQKLLSLVPGTALHREVVGLGHAEAAARAFNNGGAAKLLGDPDGALQVATLSQSFDDILSGTTRIRGSAIAYLPSFRNGAPMTLSTVKGQEIINVARNLRIGNGNSQLVSLMEVGGTKLGTNPAWLRGAPDLVDDIVHTGHANREVLGRQMAGNAARNLGTFTNDGAGPIRHIRSLQHAAAPSWYNDLAARIAAQWPPAAAGTTPVGPGAGSTAAAGAAGAGATVDASTGVRTVMEGLEHAL